MDDKTNWQRRLNEAENYRERRKINNEFLTAIGMEGYEETEEQLDRIC